MKTTTFLTFLQNIVHAYNKLCEPLLKEYDLPQVSFDILMFLANNPEFSTAQEISEIRNIKKNLVSVHVDKLVNAGLLQRNAVVGDRRKVALSCTEKAQPIIDAGQKKQQEFYKRIGEGISEDKWAVYNDIIETMASNVQTMAKG